MDALLNIAATTYAQTLLALKVLKIPVIKEVNATQVAVHQVNAVFVLRKLGTRALQMVTVPHLAVVVAAAKLFLPAHPKILEPVQMFFHHYKRTHVLLVLMQAKNGLNLIATVRQPTKQLLLHLLLVLKMDMDHLLNSL